MKILNSLIVILVVLFMATPLLSQNDQKKISVQGFLKDANGKAVDDGEYSITFSIYDDEAVGSKLWQGTQTVNVFGGVYSAQLAAGINPQNNDAAMEIEELLWDEPYYLSVTIQGVELTPRTALTYSPYAFAVNKAQEANLAKEVECSGAVGDVKYSILAPTQFADVNGDCWVPMDGTTNMAGTPLKVLLDAMPNGFLGSNFVPDASGLFLRAHEYSDGNDSDRTPADNVAQVQQDNNKSHTHGHTLGTNYTGAHSHSMTYGNGDSGHGRVADSGASDGSLSTNSAGAHSHTITGSISNSGATEARPKNLNLYVYIRIQ